MLMLHTEEKRRITRLQGSHRHHQHCYHPTIAPNERQSMDDRSSLGTTPQELLRMPSSPQSILQRLEQLDNRLKQLEMKQRLLPQSYFSADLHQSSNPLLHTTAANFDDQQCLALADVHLKGALMDRLRMLETRILQLSNELDKDSAESSTSNDSEEIQWVRNGQNRTCDTFTSNGKVREPEEWGEKLHRGFYELPGHKPKKLQVIKEVKEGISSEEKKTSRCRNDKKRSNKWWAYRRWFAIGC